MVTLQALKAKHAGLVLLGRRGVVVGGTAGVGQAMAVRLARAKVAVTVVGRNKDRGSEVVAALHAASGPGVAHDFIEADVQVRVRYRCNLQRCLRWDGNVESGNGASVHRPGTC